MILLSRIFKTIKYLIIIFLTCLIFIIIGIFWLVNFTYNYHIESNEKSLKRQKFDERAWNSVDNDRFYMYEDLIKNHLYVGMPIDKAEKILGKELRKESRNHLNNKCYQYYMGLTNTMGFVTSFSLLICLDKSNQVVESIELIRY